MIFMVRGAYPIQRSHFRHGNKEGRFVTGLGARFGMTRRWDETLYKLPRSAGYRASAAARGLMALSSFEYFFLT